MQGMCYSCWARHNGSNVKHITFGYNRRPDQFKTHHTCINERMISPSAVLYTVHIFS